MLTRAKCTDIDDMLTCGKRTPQALIHYLVVEQESKSKTHVLHRRQARALRHLQAQSRWPRTHSRLKQAHYAPKTSTIGQAHPFDRHLHAWPASWPQTDTASFKRLQLSHVRNRTQKSHHKKVCLSRVNGLNDRVWISVLRCLVLHGQICARTRAKSFTTAYAGRGTHGVEPTTNKGTHEHVR